MNLLIIPALPILAALICGIPVDWYVAAGATLLSSIATLLLSLESAFIVLRCGKIVSIPNWISIDALGVLILVLVAFVSTTASIFSWGYMKQETTESKKLRLYYANLNLFIFSMLAVPMIQEPNLTWIAVELTTLFSILLVGFKNTQEALEAAWKYMLLTLMGAAIALLGFLILFWAARTNLNGNAYTWSTLSLIASKMHPELLKTAFILILIGFGAKVGFVPLHTWLPDAHSQAPSPVCALLSGIETTTILYVILKLLPVFEAAKGIDALLWARAVGLISLGCAAFLLIQVKDFKRLFAFSTVEHMGIIFTAAGLGLSSGHLATVMQIVTHAVTKSFCFYAAGAALLITGTRQISKVKGLIHLNPFTGIALLIGGLAIAGAPPFAVFISEFSIVKAAILAKHWVTVTLLVLFIITAFFGVMSHINTMVFGRPESPPVAKHPLPLTCKISMVLAIVPVIVFGLYIPAQLYELLKMAALALSH